MFQETIKLSGKYEIFLFSSNIKYYSVLQWEYLGCMIAKDNLPGELDAYLKINRLASAWQAAEQQCARGVVPLTFRESKRNETAWFEDGEAYETSRRIVVSQPAIQPITNRWLSWDGMRTTNCKTSS